MTATSVLGPVGEVFIGREEELARVGHVVAQVGDGHPWLLSIEGESGIGKTAFVRRCLGSASGLRVLWARADPSESYLEYGVVGQLVRQVDRKAAAGGPLVAPNLVRSSPFAVGAELLPRR